MFRNHNFEMPLTFGEAKFFVGGALTIVSSVVAPIAMDAGAASRLKFYRAVKIWLLLE